MFHRTRDASKAAVVALVQHARRVGITLIDVQVPSPHLASLGARAIPRREYLARLRKALGRRVVFGA
jgi:leucyl/phenylalanyl-tRNA--protein transferase